MTPRLRELLARYWFLAAITLVAVGGLVFPEGGERLRATALFLPFLTAGAIFTSAAGIGLTHVVEAASERTAIALGIGSTYVAAPVLAAGFAWALGPPVSGAGSEGHFFYEAVMIAAAQAGTIASAPALTLLARGNQALALLLTVSTNALTVVLTPFVLRIALGAIVSFPVGEMMSRMFFVVLLPVIAAQLMRRFIWVPEGDGRTALRLVSQSCILIFVYTGICAAAGQMSTGGTLLVRLLLVAGLLHVSLLALLDWSATALGVSEESRPAVIFCGSQKTLPNGIYLWDRFFPNNPMGALALVGYHVLQLIVDTLLVPRLTPRGGPRRSPGSG